MTDTIFPPCDPRLIEAIRNTEAAAVIAHRNPDGDALYSSLAMREVLSSLGKECLLLNEGPFLRDDIRLLEGEFSAEADKSFIERDPLVIILDCSTEDRPGTPFIPLKGLKRIVIDHHSSGVPFAEDGMSYIVPESPSTTLLVDTVRIALGVELTERMAGYLYRGFATDTGFYHFLTERTAPESLRKAAAFTEAGVSPYDVYDEMHDGRKLQDLKDTASMILAAEPHFGGRIITAYQSPEMMNARLSDGVYATLLQAEGVEGIIFIKDKGDSLEIGFRAKNRSTLDVGAIAAALGGGGHRKAAGATISGLDPGKAKGMLLSMVAAALGIHTGE